MSQRTGRLLAALVALGVGALVAAVAGRLAWPPSALPDDAQAREWMATAVPGADIAVTARDNPPFAYHPAVRSGIDRVLVPVLGGEDYRAATVELAAPVADPAAVFDAARSRLAAAGWRVGPVEQDRYGRQFTAHTDAATLTLAIDTEVGDDGLHAGRFDPRVQARIAAPPPPARLRWTIMAAWLIGAAAGWFAGRALARRTSPSTLSILGGLLVAPAALAGTYLVAVLPEGTAPWQPYMIMYLRIPALLGVMSLLVALRKGTKGTQPG